MSAERRKHLLVIDDNERFCRHITAYFQSKNMDVSVAHTGKNGLAVCEKRRVDVVLLDQQLPDGEGWSFCGALLAHTENAKVIFITAYPSFDNALKALRLGAHDYLTKPFELQELEIVVRRTLRTTELERLAKLQAYRANKEREALVIIGDEGSLEEIDKLVTLAASSPAPVLITGETGTGKNLLAASIHHRSSARTAALLSVNCSALPEHLFEAELFGYEKGAFTGAVSSKRGLFEVAEGGSLFLDEVGSIPFPLQSKLLNALEEKKIRRLGGTSYHPIDVRIIAATNSDIEQAIREGAFREDLYYRLNVIRIHIPPLRVRLQDLPALCTHLIRQFAPKGTISISEDEMERLKRYHWPGNVRELRNVLERAVLIQRGPIIRPSEFIVQSIASPRQSPDVSPVSYGQATEVIPLEQMERRLIAAALAQETENYTRTARILGISLSTLKRKVKKYGLARNRPY